MKEDFNDFDVEYSVKDRDFKTDKNKIYLYDTSWFMYRGYHALRLSVKHNGVDLPTGHLYLLIKTILDLKNDSSHILCLDSKFSTVLRRQINPFYKANRDSSGVNIHKDTMDLAYLASLLDDVFVSYKTYYESDDVMYSLASTLSEKYPEKEIFIYSGDNDLLQSTALSDNVKVMRNHRNGKFQIYDRKETEDKYKVPVESLPFYRAVKGDSSDNLEGIKRFPTKLLNRICKAVRKPEDVYKLHSKNPTTVKWINRLKENYTKLENNFKIMNLTHLPKLYVYRLKGDKSLVEKYKFNRLYSVIEDTEIKTIGE